MKSYQATGYIKRNMSTQHPAFLMLFSKKEKQPNERPSGNVDKWKGSAAIIS